MTDGPELLAAIGRVLLGGLFLVGGIRHLGILPILTQAVAARGVPMPRLALIGATTIQIVAGALLMAGFLVPYAALVLAMFTVSVTVLMLPFWSLAGEERATAVNSWLSNTATLGGLLMAVAHAISSN